MTTRPPPAPSTVKRYAILAVAAAALVLAVVPAAMSRSDHFVPAACAVSGNGQCGPGVPGGPVIVAEQWVCTDPAAVLITNGVGVTVCDYHLISTA